MEKRAIFWDRRRTSRASMLLLLGLLISLDVVRQAEAFDTVFKVNNTALTTTGGIRFRDDVGNTFALSTLKSAKAFIVQSFNKSPEKRIDLLTLFVDDIDGVAYTTGTSVPYVAETHLSARYVGSYSPGDKTALQYEITGVLTHESTHVYQNSNGNYGTDPYFTGVIEGIADFIRLRSGYPATSWVKQAGGHWYDGYSTTAFFLDWIDKTKYTGFVNELNYLMNNPWQNSFFKQITGTDVDTLWTEYQATL